MWAKAFAGAGKLLFAEGRASASSGFFGRAFGLSAQHHKSAAVWNLVNTTLVAGGLTYLFSPQDRKIKDTANTVAGAYLFMGFGPVGQLLGSGVLNAAMHAGDYTKNIGGFLRGDNRNRSMASVPFSYSTQGMDLAGANFQQTRQIMNSNYGLVGNEATMFASRYLHR